jgi:hypothetical protein
MVGRRGGGDAYSEDIDVGYPSHARTHHPTHLHPSVPVLTNPAPTTGPSAGPPAVETAKNATPICTCTGSSISWKQPPAIA